MKAGLALNIIGIHAFSEQEPMLDMVGRKAVSQPSLPAKDIGELCILWARSVR